MRQQTSGQNQLQFMVHTEVMPPLVPPSDITITVVFCTKLDQHYPP